MPKGTFFAISVGNLFTKGLNERAADIALDMSACEITWILQLHLFPQDLLAVDLRPSHMTSCAFTRDGGVKSHVMLFLIQQ